MIVSIHQPNHLPYLGFFDKIARSDKFIVYDDAQFVKGDFHNRNKIRTQEGFQWLTVPVNVEFGDTINKVRIDNSSFWAKKHFKSITANYGNAPYFRDYIESFEKIYSKTWNNLAELNIEIIQLLIRFFNIKTPIVKSTELGNFKSKSTERLVDFCREVGATVYLSGSLGKNYIDKSVFEQAGIKVEYQNFNHPIYKQNFEGFIPNMSAIDLLFNCGGKSLSIIMQDNINKEELKDWLSQN